MVDNRHSSESEESQDNHDIEYGSEFVENDQGKCERIHLPFMPDFLCKECRDTLLGQKWMGCYNKAKYILRSKTGAYRDIRVCGTHKRHLLSQDSKDNYYATDQWQVIDSVAVRKAIELLERSGYSVKDDSD